MRCCIIASDWWQCQIVPPLFNYYTLHFVATSSMINLIIIIIIINELVLAIVVSWWSGFDLMCLVDFCLNLLSHSPHLNNNYDLLFWTVALIEFEVTGTIFIFKRSKTVASFLWFSLVLCRYVFACVQQDCSAEWNFYHNLDDDICIPFLDHDLPSLQEML